MFDRNTSLLAGMSTEQLQAALSNAQQAYLDLSTGAKGVSFSYSQGDGNRSVSYTPTTLPNLISLIQLLQAQLGIGTRPRRAIRFRY